MYMILLLTYVAMPQTTTGPVATRPYTNTSVCEKEDQMLFLNVFWSSSDFHVLHLSLAIRYQVFQKYIQSYQL